MKNVIFFISGLFLVIATCDVAGAAFTYADQVIYMDPTPMGAPNHAPSMNMNWLNNPGDLCSNPNPYNDRLLGAYDQYAIGWGPAGLSWTGTANAIVKMEKPFTHDGVVATGGNVEHTVTDEGALSGMGYDLVVYGLGYGFDGPFESHGQIRVWVAEELSGNIDDWILVSSWSGDPNGYGDDPPTYFENQDGTLKDGIAFNNGGFGAWSHTFMTIDLDNPKIIDPATGELMNVGPITGVYNYIWFEGGYYEDDGSTHSNANFLDAFAAHRLNHEPVAEDDELTVYENTSGTGSLIASDIDGDDLTCSIVETGNHGLAEILDESTGSYRYTPETDYTGSDTLKFKANDGEADSNIATITITIREVEPDNNPPIAQDGQLAIFENEVGNGNFIASDIDGDDLTYAIVENADHGLAVILDPITGSYQYTPETDYTGADTFSFKANDGEVDSGTAIITITVRTVNDVPKADAGIDQTTYSGDTVTLDASGSSDPDDDEITYQWDQIAGPEVGISDKSAIRPTFTAPDIGLEGETLTFELTVSDGEFSDTDTVTVAIVYNIVAVSVFAISVTEQRGCISWRWGVPDEGANAVGRPDYESNGDLSGWTNTSGYLTLAFDVPLADGEGDDVIIHYSGQGEAMMAVSQDGAVWTYPVPLPAVMEGDHSLHQASYDLSELGLTSLCYVKIEKTETAGGIFVDAVEGLHLRAVRVYATSVKDQSGCVSRSFDPDGGEHTLGEPDFETGGDYSGWIDNTVGYLTLGFNAPIADGQGNDLTIYHSGWAEASVAVSKDGQNWTDPVELPEGVGAVHQYSYDFTELGIASARYVKIIKEEASGVRFIDAIKGHYGISRSVDPADKDQTVKEGMSVTLGASSNPLSAVYRWAQIEDGAPLVIFSADSAPNPTFVAPSVPAGEELVLTFQLYVDDNDCPFETTATVVDNGITDISGDAQFTFGNPVSGKNMGISCDGGDITDYDIIDPDIASSVDMTDGPEDLIYGLISFEAQVAAGDTVAVTIYLPEPAPAGYKWYKYNDTDGWFDFSRDVISGGTGEGAEFNDDRTRITLYITDNGDYDDDKMDGVIRDPSGLGQSAGTGDEPGGDGSAGGGSSGGGCFISASAYGSSLTPLYVVFIVFALSWIMTGTRFRMQR